MYYLEKIDTSSIFGDTEHFCMPGCVDIFLCEYDALHSQVYQRFTLRNIAKHFKEIFIAQCEQHDIFCATKHGVQGIDINELLITGPEENTLYEIGLTEFLSLPIKYTRELSNINIVVHDYSEAGFSRRHHSVPPEVQQMLDLPNVRFATDNLDESKFNINKHFFQTVADSIEVGIPPLSKGHTGQTLALIRKPRTHRLSLLDHIDRQGLLGRVDWSLNTGYKPLVGDYCQDHALGNDWEDEQYLSSHPFVERHRAELPKELYTPAGQYVSPNILHPDFSCKYKLYLSVETHFDVPFITEKTAKAFVGGLPVAVYGNQTSVDYLHSIGFQCIRLGDTMHQQLEDICELIESHEVDHDMVKHNHDLITDKAFITGLCVSAIHSMFKKTM